MRDTLKISAELLTGEVAGLCTPNGMRSIRIQLEQLLRGRRARGASVSFNANACSEVDRILSLSKMLWALQHIEPCISRDKLYGLPWRRDHGQNGFQQDFDIIQVASGMPTEQKRYMLEFL